MAGILTFQQYIGGADSMQLLTSFPSSQQTKLYSFNTDITGWTFEADYQTIIVDTLAYDRHTGDPNFSNSKVIGTFPKVDMTAPNEPIVINASEGNVKLIIPSNMYTGPIIPDARKNVPIVIVAFTWTTADTPATTDTHRWAVIQSWEPDVEAGDPTADVNYVSLSL